MKKLMILAATLILVLGVSVPVMAQPTFLEAGNEAESGDLATEFSVANEGDFASQCVPAQQFGNTGNLNDSPAFVQNHGEADDFEPGGLAVGLGGSVAVDCASTVQQSSAASSKK